MICILKKVSNTKRNCFFAQLIFKDLFSFILKILLLFFPILGLSQSLVVSEIAHKGNSYTLDYIVKREIRHPLQMHLDSALAIQDRNRLINLGIFADVKWQAIPLEDMTLRLEFEILENDDFFGGRFVGAPAPGYDEETGWSLGGGGVFRNFRGRNEQVGGGFSLGGRNTFALFYYNPWISGDHISFNAEVLSTGFRHPYLSTDSKNSLNMPNPFNIHLKSVEMNTGRYFGYERRVSIGFEIEELSLTNDSLSFIYQYFAPQGSFIYDTRDLYANPTRGFFISQGFSSRIDLNRALSGSYTWFQSFSIYKQLSNSESSKPWIAAWGIKSQTSFGSKDRNFLTVMGGSNSVRGFSYPSYFSYQDINQQHRFGFHKLTSSVELRKVIIPRFVVFDRYEFGTVLAAYVDWGISSQGDYQEIFKMSPLIGAGFSLQFEGPWPSGIIRLDYGYGFFKGNRNDSMLHFEIGNKI